MLYHVYVENAEDVGGGEIASFVIANSETLTGRGSAKRDVDDRPCRLRISYNSLATPLAICSSEFNLGKIWLRVRSQQYQRATSYRCAQFMTVFTARRRCRKAAIYDE